jgi:predicted peptidase
MASAGASALVSAIQVDRSRMPAVVVFPQAAPDTNWGFPVMQEMVSKQLDAVIAEFNGDVDRIYLWGHSMGGGGVLRLAARWPERFAAAVESAGWPTVSRNISQARADEDRTANPFLSASDPYAALAGIITRLPIWVFHSDADSTVPVEQSRMLVSALRAAGAEVRYTEYSGLTHNETGAKVPTEADLAPWLLGQKRLTAAR